MGEKSEKEERIRAITRMYYSNPKVQQILLEFSKDREVVPRYFEGFGKRPDAIQYPSDIMGLVNKGATSFHSSEELWFDPLKIDSNMNPREFNEIRKGWDLIIDIDSPFLDCSRIAAKLIIAALEHHGIKNYGLKFSGSKGFHLIVNSKAFPKEYHGIQTKDMFPEWPRAISEYLMNLIKRDYNIQVGKILSDGDVIARTNIKKEDLKVINCRKCLSPAKKGNLVIFSCPNCNMKIERRNFALTKRKLRCLNPTCAGFFDVEDTKEHYYCENCKDPENEKMQLSQDKYPEEFEEFRGINAEQIADLDLVLVAPRHLFRMPYSLHEKTSLASVVLLKEELDSFSPKDASPMSIKIRNFFPDNYEGEAENLLARALDWKKTVTSVEESIEKKKYANYQGNNDEKIDISGVTEEMFPLPISKLLKGLRDGKKRGLFVLITFLRSLNFTPDYINNRIREWNKLNEPPLKEGYIRSQIEWHLRQKKKILPPNYNNNSFYQDLGLIDKKPETKNPIVDVIRKARYNK